VRGVGCLAQGQLDRGVGRVGLEAVGAQAGAATGLPHGGGQAQVAALGEREPEGLELEGV
jgi:hypothetical protein